MSRKIWTAVVLIIVIGFGSLTYYINNKTINSNPYDRQDIANEIIQKPEKTVNVKHQFKDGVHTYIGTIELPNPCYLPLKTNLNSSENEMIIEINYSLNQEAVCTQQIIEEGFKISFEGQKNESVLATINGELVNLNIFEINPEDDIEEYEIFIKG